jgi:hypothetical protein
VTVSRIAAEKNLDLTCSLTDEMIRQGKAKAGVIVGPVLPAFDNFGFT